MYIVPKHPLIRSLGHGSDASDCWWPREVAVSGVAPHPDHELLDGDPSWRQRAFILERAVAQL